MKKYTLILFLILLQQMANAQKKDEGYAGVYLTKENFINNHLSYKIDTRSGCCKLEFPPIADWALTIRIVTTKGVYKFKPGTVYGYYENGKVYRYAFGDNLYVPQDYYKIEEDRGLVIYTAEFNGGNEYFYSIDLATPIHRLNLKNLKQDFRSDLEFIDALKRLNKEEVPGDLSKRDDDGKFIINKIYRQTIKK